MKKKTNIKTVIRKIVREEVAMAIQEVITELKQPTQQVSQPQTQKKIVEKKTFSKNSVLNDVLNETATSSPQMDTGDSTYPNMNDKVYTSDSIGEVMGTSKPMTDIESKILNKDYRSILNKSIEKTNQKQGM